jgi:GT2 family glycosyltransferase
MISRNVTVDIIIPTFGQEEYTVKCLKSIKKYTSHIDYRIIWVDNGSSRESRNIVMEELKNHKYKTIWSNERLGFVKAINLGISGGIGEFVVLQNNDTTVSKNWLDNLLNPFFTDKKVMVAGCNTTKGTSQQSWDLLNKNKKRWGKYEKFPDLSIYPNDDDKVEILEKTFGDSYMEFQVVAFFSVVIRRKIIEKVGSLDEDFEEGYYDDDHFCHKVRLAKGKIVYVPTSYVHHFTTVTFSKIYDWKDLYDMHRKNEKILKKKKEK